MSNIEIVQKAYEAFGAGDMEKLASLMSDDYVAILPEGVDTKASPGKHPPLAP